MKKNKLLIQNSITYAIVVACWILVQILGATGHMTSLLKGLLVPLCIYVILAVSLNLTVGILGELSLGHAGFMCVGAFTGAFFTKCMENAIPSVGMRFFHPGRADRVPDSAGDRGPDGNHFQPDCGRQERHPHHP